MTSSISVVIPCYPPHIKFLIRSLQTVAGQTLKPIEAVIGLSETSEEDGRQLELFFSKLTPCRVITSTKKCPAAENRNNAMAKARGDVIVFLDADDMMHPQKLEIVDYYIKKTQSKLLLHGYVQGMIDYPPYSLENIRTIGSDEMLHATFGTPAQRFPENETGPNGDTNCYAGPNLEVMHSCATVTRDVVEKIHYISLPTDTRCCEDGRFCRDVLWHYRSACYLCAKLLTYIK